MTHALRSVAQWMDKTHAVAPREALHGKRMGPPEGAGPKTHGERGFTPSPSCTPPKAAPGHPAQILRQTSRQPATERTTTMSEAGSNRLAVLAEDIRTAHASVEAAALMRAKRALEAGRGLIEAKSLLKHGRWLPWLKENCRIPERTAQLYMKLADLGVPPEIIAVIGMERAATEVIVMGNAPDELAKYDEPMQQQWLLFALFTRDCEHTDWVMRKGYASPDEWLADTKTRQRWRSLVPAAKQPVISEPSEAFLKNWAAHKEKYADTPRPEIEAMLTAAFAPAAA